MIDITRVKRRRILAQKVLEQLNVFFSLHVLHDAIILRYITIIAINLIILTQLIIQCILGYANLNYPNPHLSELTKACKVS